VDWSGPRTNAFVVVALAGLAAAFFALGAATWRSGGLVPAGGYLGLIVGASAGYPSCASYARLRI
jgi:succinate-acetate transporter protein